ncbi:hypothetical protein N7499_011103 [Penicillium canescens]|uniref:Uncharacterized protein n=1 Tax=Penicillium canescens TaxID=5083 RepID=A0AAD6IKY5_PENCN|nr:uncharacterized protein N7446_006359 [Penicillium canescens]KAJ6051725.1 hypothetical protein N7460_002259 [Penicillium canescens]KAJ6062239.1 hypothetical protein N7446_006359 [Penicillium canescens]KAJ6065487.1 hypothetical protein N7444_001140 [Penicillium canescens]KAJ6069216.1 hypothetical protein N7499_011103 [Penicillium canescens]KAJ6182734.1 hypothetical protein N7485_001376 [Penicillium canescens]
MFLGRLSVKVRNRMANGKVCKALGVDQIIKKPIKVVLENSAARREDRPKIIIELDPFQSR